MIPVYISLATRDVESRGHKLCAWIDIDPQRRVPWQHVYWAVCQKCDGSVFLNGDGSYRGLFKQCPSFQFGSWALPYLERPATKHVEFRPSVMNYCPRSFPSS